MGTVHSIEEALPHVAGEARCVACKHEFVAVTPVGVDWFECPKCGLMKSRFMHPVVRGQVLFTCQCGCDTYHIAPSGPYCTNCGDWADGWQGPHIGPAA